MLYHHLVVTRLKMEIIIQKYINIIQIAFKNTIQIGLKREEAYELVCRDYKRHFKSCMINGGVLCTERHELMEKIFWDMWLNYNA